MGNLLRLVPGGINHLIFADGGFITVPGPELLLAKFLSIKPK